MTPGSAVWAQLFKTNDVVSKRIVKTLVIKYGIYSNIFAEKCEQLICKSYSYFFFSAKLPVNYKLYLLEQLTF